MTSIASFAGPAASRSSERLARNAWRTLALKETNVLGAIESMVAMVNTANGESLQPLIDKQFAMMKQTDLSVETSCACSARSSTRNGGQGRAHAGPARAPARVHRESVSCAGRAPQSRARDDADVRRQPQAIAKILAAVPQGETKTSNCSCTISPRSASVKEDCIPAPERNWPICSAARRSGVVVRSSEPRRADVRRGAAALRDAGGAAAPV